jgi:hypothetical protein
VGVPSFGGPFRSAAVDTLILASFSFDEFAMCAPQGWTSVDRYSPTPLAIYTHVADLTELDGGDFGTLVPLEGFQSMWCGVDEGSTAPHCGYQSLPGYGNNWDQNLETNTLIADSIRFSYKISWDSEPDYDETVVEYYDYIGGTWVNFDGADGGLGYYDGNGLLDECWMFPVPYGETIVRFRFRSDGSWSDEDGIQDTDGAFTVDSLTIELYSGGFLTGSLFEDFEGEAPGDTVTGDSCWSAGTGPGNGYGDFAGLFPGVAQVQEDGCAMDLGCLWAFHDGSTYDYTCGGFPAQAAVPYGPGAGGFYIANEIWSPRIAFTGDGNSVLLSFDVYKDLRLENLVFFTWRVRSIVGGCPTEWRDHNYVYYGGHKFWLPFNESIGDLIEPGATHIQIALGVIDMFPFWGGILGDGACHSHAPLFDNVELRRINIAGPQWSVRHVDLFQDNFSSDGTITGTARADMADDRLPPTNPVFEPGDSTVVTVSDPTWGLYPDPHEGSMVYTYVSLLPQGQPGKSGPDLEAPETRAGIGERFPLVDSLLHDGAWWYRFQMDTAFTAGGSAVSDQWCFDLNDEVFTPGDTISYVFSATNTAYETSYFSRRLSGQGDNFVTDDISEALESPMEFTILPAGGWIRGGDILYVDDADDRGGPAQIFFDSAFDWLNIRQLVDRYDILDPSSIAGNSLASRVTDVAAQIMECYKKIIWNSGNRESGLLGDGIGNPKKSDDFALLFSFLDQHTDNPGVYISGDDIAEEWVTLGGAGALNLRGTYMNFNLVSTVHHTAGDVVSPLLSAVGSCFTHVSIPDTLIAFGGCPVINDFDILGATGLSLAEFNSSTGNTYILSQQTPNAALSTARFILSGFSYHEIRDVAPGFPIARVEHLRDILTWFENMIDVPTGIDPPPQLADYLESNYPNPFNQTTTIRYGVKNRAHVSLKIYNVAGQLVKTLVNEVKEPAAVHKVNWDGRNKDGGTVASGVYFYKLVTDNFAQTKKMVLLK